MVKRNIILSLCLGLSILFISACTLIMGALDESVVMQSTAAPNGKYSAIRVGDIIHFGSYNWKVLALYDDDTALIITENIIKSRSFHNTWESVTWEESDIREYLNSIFLDTFDYEYRRRILPKHVYNSDNQWFWVWDAIGGNDTTDYIFLLSIEEVVMYFGDSGQLGNPKPWNVSYSTPPQTTIDDEYNNIRIAFDKTYEAAWWWLRSPGAFSDFIALIRDDGIISMEGTMVITGHWSDYSPTIGGLRPALLLNLAY